MLDKNHITQNNYNKIIETRHSQKIDMGRAVQVRSGVMVSGML